MNRLAMQAREHAAQTGMLPHEFLLAVARGQRITRKVADAAGIIQEVEEAYDFDTRLDAAKAAAPYYAPKISTVEVIHGMGDEQLDDLIERAAAEAGFGVVVGGESPESEDEAPEPPARPSAPGAKKRRIVIDD